MDAYAEEFWDRILPSPFAAVRGEAISDYGVVLAHGMPWALETW